MKIASPLQELPGAPTAFALWEDGLACATEEGVWTTSLEGEERVTLEVKGKDTIYGMAGAPGHPWLYGCGEKWLYRWDKATGELAQRKKNDDFYCSTVTIHPSLEWIAWSSDTGVGISNIESFAILDDKQFPSYSDEGGERLYWLGDSDSLVCINAQGILTYQWNGTKLKKVGKKRGFGGGRYWGMFWDLDVTPDGQWIVAMTDPCGGGDGNRLYLWKADDTKHVKRFDFPENFDNPNFASNCTITPDGSHVIINTDHKDGWISFWNTETFVEETPDIRSPEAGMGPELRHLQCHKNGRYLFGFGRTRESDRKSRVLIWDMESGEVLS